ncbi:hypothetical protein AB0I16_14025 [Streptomyces sp. NPDC050703]|uniref:hypothetical protein n=1 Tax=Streptomyces sp. NPDC050703 TaxID=3157218 RepID=UPI0034339321
MGDQESAEEDLTELLGALAQVDRDIDTVGEQVVAVQGEVSSLRDEVRTVASTLDGVSHTMTRVEDAVRQLGDAFDEFTDRYAKDQVRAMAEAELTRLTVDWNARFEQRRRTRALAHGLVSALTRNALEHGTVDKDLVAACAQERMLMAPDFWLGPAMVALAARHLDRAEQMHRARGHAYSLDSARSNLFFALACTRLGEQGEAASWMDRYLQALDPYNLDEDFHVVLDAVACHELGITALSSTQQAMNRWLGRLDLSQSGLLVNQVAHHMGALAKELPIKTYRELSIACGADWDALRRGWEWATVPQSTLAHLRDAFPADRDDRPHAGHADSALDALIDRHDADEAALATRIGYLELVIEHGGDERGAREEHAARQIAARPVDLRTLLVNAVFTPESVRLGHEARLLALRAVWPQMRRAFQAYADRSESLLPTRIDVTWDQWRCPLPADPDKAVAEETLIRNLRGKIEERTRHRVESVRIDAFRFIAANAVILMSAASVFLVPRGTPRIAVILTGVAAAVWAAFEWRRVPSRKEELSREGRHTVHAVTSAASRTLAQRVAFFTAWRENLDAVSRLEDWAEQAWQGEAGALEAGPAEERDARRKEAP